MKKDPPTTMPRFTSADLEAFPDDGKRYEIIDGELYVSKQPHIYHQRAFARSYGSNSTSGRRRLGTARPLWRRA